MELKKIIKTSKLLTISFLSLVATSMTAQTYSNPSSSVSRRHAESRPNDPGAPMLAKTFNSARQAEAFVAPSPEVSATSYFNSGDLMNPASNIYNDWKNKGVKAAPGYAPSRLKIDLRGFHMPTPSRKITSPYGQRWGRLHAGLDIKVYIGDTICAAFDGKVRVVDYDRNGYGNFVVIRHPNGLETLYGHMSKHLVKNNQIVRAGEPIGLGGNTGRSTGSHLHFETRLCGVPINPALMFDFPHQDVTGDFFTTTKAYGTRE